MKETQGGKAPFLVRPFLDVERPFLDVDGLLKETQGAKAPSLVRPFLDVETHLVCHVSKKSLALWYHMKAI